MKQENETQFTLSISEIATRLMRDNVDISESTVRKYATKTFTELFPSYKPKGERWPLYAEVSVAIAKRLYELSRKGELKRHEIGVRVQEEFKSQLDDLPIIIEGEGTTRTPNEPSQQHSITPPTASHHPHSLVQADYNNRVVESMLLSLENSDRLMQRRDRELRELMDENTELHGELETAKTELDEKDAEIERLTEELEKEKNKKRRFW